MRVSKGSRRPKQPAHREPQLRQPPGAGKRPAAAELSATHLLELLAQLQQQRILGARPRLPGVHVCR